MAKKATKATSGSIFDIVKSIDDSAEILSESSSAVIDDYVNTGSYIVNAALTGSIFKGVPSGRITCLAGNPSTGKTYLALSICREAQKKGYTPIVLDSEGAIDKMFCERLGLDTTNMINKQVTTVSEVNTFMSNILNDINEQPKKTRPKVIFVLDSLGNLSSTKEMNDTAEGNGKTDMSRNRDIKALFRTVATPIAKAQSIFIVNSHIYKTLDLYGKTVINGGQGIAYSASITLLLTTSKLDDKQSDKIAEKKVGDFTKTGVIVTAKTEKSRFTIPQNVRFQIPFFKAPNPYVGLENYITWENSGILRGKILSEKEYSKLSDLEKNCCCEMKDNKGNTCYAFPKDTSKSIVVKHLGCEVPAVEMFTPKVLTEDILRNLDDVIIKPSFELPSNTGNDDIEELLSVDDGE